MSTFVIKIIALVLMVLDHIGMYFDGAPFWFRLLGRACYPLFLFCMVWGYHYTKSRKRYLVRLYIMSLFMAVLGYVLNNRFTVAHPYGNHNIFAAMLLVGLLISAVELMGRDGKRGGLLLAGVFVLQFLYSFLPGLVPILRELDGDTLTGIIPNFLACQYGAAFVALGVAMYFLREKRGYFLAVYVLFCIYQYTLDIQEFGMIDQSLMILALPVVLRYNGEKGPGMKYLFYVFYPAHTALLFVLSNFVLG